MFQVVLVAPEIPPNTGNVIRLCANTGARLHLVRPLGFQLDDRSLRRSGLDYHDLADVRVHADFAACRAALGGCRLFAVETGARQRHTDPAYVAGDGFLFGSESRGLDAGILASVDEARHVSIPMAPSNRSLNLGNSVAVVVYEAWRQLGFTRFPGVGPAPSAR
jgi:tRNA (cytidine/uridine-2'-O-)-methyltransferase